MLINMFFEEVDFLVHRFRVENDEVKIWNLKSDVNQSLSGFQRLLKVLDLLAIVLHIADKFIRL